MPCIFPPDIGKSPNESGLFTTAGSDNFTYEENVNTGFLWEKTFRGISVLQKIRNKSVSDELGPLFPLDTGAGKGRYEGDKWHCANRNKTKSKLVK